MYVLTDKNIEKSLEYANGKERQGDYEKLKVRKQCDPVLCKKQDIMGKNAEIVAYKTLKYKLMNGLDNFDSRCLTLPDFEVYPPDKKNWNPDLSTPRFKISVKSYSIHGLCKPSVIYQRSNVDGKGGCDYEAFKNDKKNLHCYVEMSGGSDIGEETQGRVIAFVSSKYLVENELFKSPMKKYLVGIKYAVYMDDLKSLGLTNEAKIGDVL